MLISISGLNISQFSLLKDAVFDLSLLMISVAYGLFIVAILHANNTRDFDTDRDNNLITVAILLGKPNCNLFIILKNCVKKVIFHS